MEALQGIHNPSDKSVVSFFLFFFLENDCRFHQILKVVHGIIKVKNHCPGTHCFYFQIKLNSGMLHFCLTLAGFKQSCFLLQWPKHPPLHLLEHSGWESSTFIPRLSSSQYREKFFLFFFFNLNGNLKHICQGWLRRQEGEVVPCREQVHKGPGSVSVSPPDDQELRTALK